jgi:hypothetical protein
MSSTGVHIRVVQELLTTMRLTGSSRLLPTPTLIASEWAKHRQPALPDGNCHGSPSTVQ